MRERERARAPVVEGKWYLGAQRSGPDQRTIKAYKRAWKRAYKRAYKRARKRAYKRA